MNDKREIIDKIILEITDKSLNYYLSNVDEKQSSGSIEDWKNGCRVNFTSYDGYNKSPIRYSDFENLYSNIKNDLNNPNITEQVLDKIINYLEKEKQYDDYFDLDNENYSINEIIELLSKDENYNL